MKPLTANPRPVGRALLVLLQTEKKDWTVATVKNEDCNTFYFNR